MRGAAGLGAWCLLGLTVAGCGESGTPDAGPDRKPASQDAAPSPDFARDVAPLLYKKCASCHHEQGAGPFALIEYGEVRDHGEQIVEVTQSGYMPPWLPAAGQLHLVGESERSLSLADKRVLAQWVEAGMPSGDLERAPKPPHFASGWELGPPDLIVQAQAAYELPAAGADIYRNFVIAVPPGPPRYVKSVELRPGSAQVVHHAVMRVDTSGEARRLDALDALPGFDGMVFGGARMPGGHFIGWTPGKSPDPGSEARAWQLVSGAELVVQVHMRPSGKPTPIQPEVGLHFSSQPPSKPGLAMLLSSSQLDIPAGEADYRVRDSFELPADVELISIYPHAHYIGKRMRALAVLPGGRQIELIRIDDWDFNWQDQYRYAKALSLPKGSVISMDYGYDNSASNPRNPFSPPQRVVYGPRSTDEMAELILEIEPKDPRDYAVLDAAFMRKWLDGQIRAQEHELAGMAEPSAEALATLAALLARAGRSADAVARYDASLAVVDDASVRVELALLCYQTGQLERGAAELDAAEALAPDYARIYLVRGNQERTAGEFEDARGSYERALQADPQLAEAHNNLGVTFEKLGQPKAAARSFAQAVALVPGRALFHQNHGRALEAAGRSEEALAAYRAALERDPRSVRALRGVAWILATHPSTSVRDPAESIRAAEAAGRLTGFRSPEVLEALAAGFAASGRFEDARQAMKRALELASAAQRPDLSARYQSGMARLTQDQTLK